MLVNINQHNNLQNCNRCVVSKEKKSFCALIYAGINDKIEKAIGTFPANSTAICNFICVGLFVFGGK